MWDIPQTKWPLPVRVTNHFHMVITPGCLVYVFYGLNELRSDIRLYKEETGAFKVLVTLMPPWVLMGCIILIAIARTGFSAQLSQREEYLIYSHQTVFHNYNNNVTGGAVTLLFNYMC